MRAFYVRAEPLGAEGPSAAAIVVAENSDQALLLLRKDIDFSGYRLPPAEMIRFEAAPEEIRRRLGEAAAHEIGVYRFTLLEPSDPAHTGMPPAAVS